MAGCHGMANEHDQAIYHEVPGGPELIRHFGRIPSFHDGEVLDLHLNRNRPSTLRVHGWVMTDGVGRDGTLVLERHAVVTFTLHSIMDLQLDGFSIQNVIGGLILRRAPDRPERRASLRSTHSRTTSRSSLSLATV